MTLKLLKDRSVVEKLEHFANVANEMSSKLVVKDDITDDYNVNRNGNLYNSYIFNGIQN